MALTQISTAGVKDDAVTSGKIPANAVGSSELADNAVDTNAIQDDAVTADKIVNNAVTQGKIASDSISAGLLQSNSVTTAKIADDAVSDDKLSHTPVSAGSYTAADITVNAQGRIIAANSGTIATSEIADNAVTTAKIADDAVGHDQIADNSIHHHHIADGTIVTADLADDAVTGAKIGDNAISTNHIADQAIDLTKLEHGTSSNDGKFLRANNGADPSYEAIPISARNLIINGDMRVAQRGTSVASTGFQTVDRWQFGGNWQGSAITQEQADIGYTTVPYDKGFRKAYKLTNSNQGSAAASDNIEITYSFEGDEIATSGWDYVNSSKKITLSFWVKSSVAQTFYGYFRTFPGVDMKYSFPIVCSSTNWEYKTVSINGESNFAQNVHNSFGSGTGRAMVLRIVPFYGTSYTDSGAINNAWQNYSASNITPVFDTSWYLTSGATFEITGVQLEVGESASDFAFRNLTQEQQLCKRYFQKFGGSSDHFHFGLARAESNTARTGIVVPVPMRTSPTVASNGHRTFDRGYNSESTSTPSIYDSSRRNTCLTDAIYTIDFGGHSLTHNRMYVLMSKNTGDLELTLDAEM